MSIEVRIPELPESVADATLLEWNKKVGESVSQGENLVDLETDKVVLELPAPASGVLKEILVDSGETVESAVLVAYIDEAAVGDTPKAEPKSEPAKASEASPKVATAPAKMSEAETVEVRIPELPESVADATLLDWYKKVGESVSQGENLVDLETDKVVLELPAPASGVLKEILVETGKTVEADVLVAYIAAGDAPAPAAAPMAEAAPMKEPAPTTITSNASIASPAAKKMMKETGNSDVTGTGKAGRITKQDVLGSLSGSTARLEERVPMTRLRARVAERLVEAQQEAALLTTFNEVNMKPIMDLRSKYKDLFEKKHDTRLGFMSFFVKAVSEALKAYPAVNASVDGKDIIYHNYFDIGIAVSSPRGLVVPILRNADEMSFAEVEATIREFGAKAKSGTLTIEEMTGGTFSITNGGVFGSMMSTPIVNPPQAAILGMHNIVERAVVENGEIVARPMMYLALTYDHRLIDGKESVSFLVHVKNALEDPARLLLDV